MGGGCVSLAGITNAGAAESRVSSRRLSARKYPLALVTLLILLKFRGLCASRAHPPTHVCARVPVCPRRQRNRDGGIKKGSNGGLKGEDAEEAEKKTRWPGGREGETGR
jgi:hypothetical protein